MGEARKASGGLDADDFGRGVEAFVGGMALRIGLERSRYGVANGYSQAEQLRPGTRVAPFDGVRTDRRYVYGPGKGFQIGTRLGKDEIVSFDVQEPSGARYRMRLGAVPDVWNPARGGSEINKGGPVDKYLLTKIEVDETGKPVPGKDWDMRYAGDDWDQYCVGVGMPLVLPRPRSDGELAADRSAQPNPLSFNEVNPRDPGVAKLLFEPRSVITNAQTFRLQP